MTVQEIKDYFTLHKPSFLPMRTIAQSHDRFKSKMVKAMQPIDWKELAGTNNSHVGILLQFGVPPLSTSTGEFINWTLRNLRQAKQMCIVVPEVNSSADRDIRKEMKLYSLFPTQKQFVAAAAYLIAILSPKKALIPHMNQVGELWEVAKKLTDANDDLYALQMELEKVPEIVQFIFSAAARIGRWCLKCVTLRPAYLPCDEHNCDTKKKLCVKENRKWTCQVCSVQHDTEDLATKCAKGHAPNSICAAGLAQSLDWFIPEVKLDPTQSFSNSTIE